MLTVQTIDDAGAIKRHENVVQTNYDTAAQSVLMIFAEGDPLKIMRSADATLTVQVSDGDEEVSSYILPRLSA